MHMAPWNQPRPSTAWDVLQADGVIQFHPWRDLVFDAWSKGQLPLWNPYQLCGTPLLANSQSAPFYPLHVLMGLLHIRTLVAITLLAWFHLAWGSLGARFLAKTLGATDNGALFSGVAFGLSTFMVAWTPLASVLTTCSWIPWVLAFGLVSTRAEPSPTMPQRARSPLLLLGLSVAMLLLSGHLQFAAYGLIGQLVVCLVSAIQGKPPVRTYISVTVAVVAGSCLAMPQILPAIAFSRLSHRQVAATPEGAAAYSASAIGLPELAGFVFPSATGSPVLPYRPDDTAPPMPAYFPAYIKRGSAFAEGAIGIGPFAFALLFGLRRSKLKDHAPMLALAVVGILLATGSLSLLMYFAVPGWASTGSPGRAGVLLVLAFSVLAGTLMPDRIEDKGSIRRLLLGALAGLVATLAILVVCSQMKPWIPGLDSASSIVFGSGGTRISEIGAPAVLCGVGLVMLWRGQIRLGLVCGVASTMFASLLCLPTGASALEKFQPDPSTRNAFVNSDWGLLQAAPALMPGNTASAERLYDVGGYDSLLSKETLEVLRTINSGNDPAPPANGNMMFVKLGFDFTKLMDAGVTLVWSRKALPGMPSIAEREGELYLYHLPSMGRAFTPLGSAQILEDGYDHQVLRAEGPGTLVVRDRNMPGWSAEVDGKPTKLRGSPWREIELPTGAHTVRFTYDAPGLKLGLLFGLAGVISLGSLYKVENSMLKKKSLIFEKETAT